MRIATWNVNSLKVRLPHVLAWLEQHRPDALCLQEIKLEDANFPHAEFAAAGWTAASFGQKTYNGVAIVTREALTDVARGIPDFVDDQSRVIAGTLHGVRLICAYVPNGQSVGSDKYAYKLRWLDALIAWLGREMVRSPSLALLGDYNIAPEDRDVHDPAAWAGNVLVSDPERAAFKALTTLGLSDGYRLFEQTDDGYTWWDYRMNGFRRNLGLRIDHILMTGDLAARCRSCRVDREPRKLERPSDHAPVLADIDLGTA
jgi:exodeoxyribonuclease III